MDNLVIRTKRLSKNYDRHLGIADVDSEVRAGEVFGYLALFFFNRRDLAA